MGEEGGMECEVEEVPFFSKGKKGKIIINRQTKLKIIIYFESCRRKRGGCPIDVIHDGFQPRAREE